MARPRAATLLAVLLGVALPVCIGTSPAGAADFGIVPDSTTVELLDAEGNPDTRAGGHPDKLVIAFDLETEDTGTSVRDLVFELPPGLGGDPTAVPTCPRPTFRAEACPANTRVGVFELKGSLELSAPIYNITPAPNQIAALAFRPFWQTQMTMELRPADSGLTLSTTEIPQLPVTRGEVELWGVPADHVAEPPTERKAFLTNPTACGPLNVTFRTRSWIPDAPWVSAGGESEPLTGCEDLLFAPELDLGFTNPVADSETGAHIEIGMPEDGGPDGLAPAQLGGAEIELPPGMTISPGGIAGLEVCPDSDFGLGTAAPVGCPGASRIGSVEIVAPQLADTPAGSVYLGEERPGDRFRLFIAAAGRGVQMKLVSKLRVDPQSGSLTVVLEDLPQVALRRMVLRIGEGDRTLLTSPLSCGRVTLQGRFESSAGTSATASASDDIDRRPGSSCAGPPAFSPAVVAGSTAVNAGRPTGFSLTLGRNDGEQLIERFSVDLPSGLSAAVGLIEPCVEQAAAAMACPAHSRIGSAVAEVGSGDSPAIVHGAVYLTGPYRLAPFGIVVEFRGAVGPFDLGSLVVRGRLQFNRLTGQTAIVTDSVPTEIEGIPLRFRQMGIDLDQRGLFRNPTSCKPTQIVSTLAAVDGRLSSTPTPFRLLGCRNLDFHPRLGMTLLGGKRRLQSGSRPSLRLAVKMRRNSANLSRLRVTFPRLLAFRAAGVRELCARGDAREGLCPSGSRVGTGVAWTPLLTRPMRGPVYAVQPAGDGLPDLWSSIEGMGVELELAGRSRQRKGHLITELVKLPDMPLSRFALRIRGGKSGLFSLRRTPCKLGWRRRLSDGVATAQSGKRRSFRLRLRSKPSCTQHDGVARKRSEGGQALGSFG